MTNFSVISSMGTIFGFNSLVTLCVVVAVSAVNAVLMSFAGYKFLQMVQLSNYKMKGYFGWLKDTKFKWWGRLLVLSFLSSSAMLIANVLLKDFFVYQLISYIGLVFYLIFTTLFIINVYSSPQKTPLKYTRRMTRMVIVYALLTFVLSMGLLIVSINYIPYFEYAAIGLVPMFIPLLVCLSHYIMYPFETWHNKDFIKRAKKRLAERPEIIKIGITGSYAKTSVKNILATLLSEKYVVCSTPMSFNTPLGLARTILDNLDAKDQVFIAEMGARYVGDIKELCTMIEPNIGIITGIGNQHLLTFGTKENIFKTKGELKDHICQTGGKMFFNGDNENCRKMAEETTCEKVVSQPFDTTSNLYAKDISYTRQGMSFTLVMGKKEIKTEAQLLGEHNISNIILAANVCLELGLSLEDIANGIKKLVPSAHRLALMPSSQSLIIIDDAYNGSVEGSKAALKVLASYKGTKVVITPGLVELGKEQEKANTQLGILIGQSADYAIISGTTNYDALFEGLKQGGMAENRILRAGSLNQAVTQLYDITQPGDVVLFENDLPDNYS